MKTIITILFALITSATSHAQHTEGMLKSYLQMKDALVMSDSKAAAAYNLAFQKEIESVEAFAEKEMLINAVQKMATAADLEKQRTAFAEVSPIFWKLLKRTNMSHGLYYQYCPMKKSYWVSNEAVIKNPYYGSRMLSCGNVSEKN